LLTQIDENKFKIDELEKNVKELKIKLFEKDKLLKEEKVKNDNLSKKNKELEKLFNNITNKNYVIEIENELKLFRTYFKFSDNEKLISIKFISGNQDIDFPVITKNTDYFTKIEQILYEKYPKYRDSENYFLVNGNKINRHKTLEENKIQNNDVLTLEINNFD
jgi:hypothetical protein